MHKILIVDDNKSLLEGMTETLVRESYSVTPSESGEAALKMLARENFAVLLTDLRLPDISGLDMLKKMGEMKISTPVIVITAYGTVDIAVEAMKLGAFDFLTKPFPADEIVVKVKKAVEQHSLRQELKILSDEAEILRKEVRGYYDPDGIIGESPQMISIKKSMDQLANSTAAVLILGETGTGKELIARAIHYMSPRRNKPFIRVNCAAFAETLLESELFGHEKGAFTGAHARKLGRFELSDGGTIFLDEIAELTVSSQAKLLRVLQEREFERVGGVDVVHIDVRVVAASNKNLDGLVGEGKFREDLFYRLNVVPINLPPLRERKGDISILLESFIKRYADQNHKKIHGFTEAARTALIQYDWPGNIRELENIVERGVVLSENEWIDETALPFYNKTQEGPRSKNADLSSKVDEYEKRLVAEAMTACGNNASKAADMLGMSRSTLRYKIQKYSLHDD